MIIGVDFDNTIASYDDLMHAVAVEWGLIPAATRKSKKVIRDSIRALPDGETHWRRLQCHVYGPRMHEAVLIHGVKKFFAVCKRRGIPVWIVSHKTEYANFGEATVNLREAAMAWLEQQGFFAPHGLGLDRGTVFFESTRVEKIERIRALHVTHFIDDLEETFNEPSFPRGVEKILLAPHGQPANGADIKPFASWAEIGSYLLAPVLAGRVV